MPSGIGLYNGNIKTLQRNLIDGTLLDDLAYNYDKENDGSSDWLISNKLYHYGDAVSASATTGDLENTASAFDDANASINTANNFSYDGIGNLIADKSEEIDSIEWDAYGKIKSITRISSSAKPDLAFAYSPSGERVIKVEMTKNVDGSVKPSSSWNFTCYMRDASGNVLNTITSNNGPSNFRNEYSIYGSSRLGVWSPNAPTTYLDGLDARGDEYRIAGDKLYELANHLDNVMVVVSDKKLGYDNNSDGYANLYHADVVSANDYYAFGMIMPNRTYSSPSYRYGFNGKEKDDEAKGSSGTQYDYGFRIYDPGLGKFLSVDPLTESYPWYAPYQFAGGNPIRFVDVDGLERANPDVFKPEYILHEKLQIDMQQAPEYIELGGKKIYTTLKGGRKWNAQYYFSEALKKSPTTWSEANKAAILRGDIPIADEQFLAELGKYSSKEAQSAMRSFLGQKLQHHHILHGNIAQALPTELHIGKGFTKIWHKFGPRAARVLGMAAIVVGMASFKDDPIAAATGLSTDMISYDGLDVEDYGLIKSIEAGFDKTVNFMQTGKGYSGQFITTDEAGKFLNNGEMPTSNREIQAGSINIKNVNDTENSFGVGTPYMLIRKDGVPVGIQQVPQKQ